MATTEHKTLAEALAAFQAEAGLTFAKTKTAKVKSQRTGAEYSYKYADLGDILPVVRPLLAQHGLSWSAKPSQDERGTLTLAYRLAHASGQEDAGEMPLGVEKNCKPQELGSAITYARRYALTAQLNLSTEEDDDGGTAQHAEKGFGPMGEPFNQALMKALGAACTKLAGGESAKGHKLYLDVSHECGGYLPQSAAIALIHAADSESIVLDVEAPDVN